MQHHRYPFLPWELYCTCLLHQICRHLMEKVSQWVAWGKRKQKNESDQSSTFSGSTSYLCYCGLEECRRHHIINNSGRRVLGCQMNWIKEIKRRNKKLCIVFFGSLIWKELCILVGIWLGSNLCGWMQSSTLYLCLNVWTLVECNLHYGWIWAFYKIIQIAPDTV